MAGKKVNFGLKRDIDNARKAVELCEQGKVRGNASIVNSLIKRGKVTYKEAKTTKEKVEKFLHLADVEAAINAAEKCRKGEAEEYAEILNTLINRQGKVTQEETRLKPGELTEFLHQADVDLARRAVEIIRAEQGNFPVFLDKLLFLIRRKGVTYKEARTDEKEVLDFIYRYLT